MATTTPNPTEGSPIQEPVRPATEHASMQPSVAPPVTSNEHQAMTQEAELARLAEHARYTAPRWTAARVLKIIFYFALMTILTFVFLVLMQGVAYTDDAPTIVPGSPAELGVIEAEIRTMETDLETWIEKGLVDYRRRRQERSSEPELESIPREETTLPEPTPESMESEFHKVEEPRPEPKTVPTAPQPKSHSVKKPARWAEARIQKVAKSLPALKLKGIGAIENDALRFMETLELALSLEIEFQDQTPRLDARVLRAEIYHHLIDLSVRVGHTDNPKENLEGIRGYLQQDLGLTMARRDVYPLRMVRPGPVLDERRGSAQALAILGLILSDRINPYLELEPVMIGSVLGLRYRSGDHRYTLVPEELSKLYSDRELIEYAYGKDALGDIAVLTRRQFWGTVFTEIGSALLSEDDTIRGARFVERGLELNTSYPMAHVARARVLLRNNDLESAREELDLAVRLDPSNPRARLARFRLLGPHGHKDTIEDDLVWLTRNGSDPETGLWLAKHLSDKGRHHDAMREIERVAARADLPAALEAKVSMTREQVTVAPWVRILGDTQRSQRMRFEALERLRGHGRPEVLEILAVTLGDDNLRLARLAWKELETLTEWELPFDSTVWMKALEREQRLTHPSSH